MQPTGSARTFAASDRTSADTGSHSPAAEAESLFPLDPSPTTWRGRGDQYPHVGSASPTDPGNPLRLVIRDFETNRPASPRD
jgi:hypothetical protein